MKYSRLTKEQFEELHREFINFLATQTITAEEWKKIKAETPEVAEQELDIFSDLIWEGALSKAEYLENRSRDQLFLFFAGKDKMEAIIVKVAEPTVDLTSSEGLQWLQDNLLSEKVEMFEASREYGKDRNLDKFALIQQGSVISKGQLYRSLKEVIRPDYS